MINTSRTNSNHPDFIKLVKLLNADLEKRDGPEHPLTQFNEIDTIKNVILAYDNQNIVGCGAIKEFDNTYMEIKRIYVLPKLRGKGIANRILDELENWATELSYTNYVLVMGTNQPEAYNLYKKNGYKLVSNFRELTKIKNALCFIKEMN